MDYFRYKQGEIYAEDLAVSEIVKKVKTPFYLYSSATLKRHYQVFDEALKIENKLICYAVKANANLQLLKLLASLGCGADVVSQGEIKRALEAGIDPKKIVYSGVGKTKEEIAYAIDTEILQFNAESYEEVLMINEIAKGKSHIQDIVLRINPDIDADTNSKISTGRKGDKFGIDIDYAPEVIENIRELSNINFIGISVHIGSQITKVDPFRKAFIKTVDFVKQLIQRGIKITTLDFGGGLGVPYGENDTVLPDEYAQIVSEVTESLPTLKYIFEPGRLLVANAGILVSSVILVKKTPYKNFAIIDAAMNDLLRPALYDAKHQIEPAFIKNNPARKYDVVGPVCETSDVLVKDISLPEVEADDVIIIRSAGAYGAVMASTYNLRPLVKEVVVDGDIIL